MWCYSGHCPFFLLLVDIPEPEQQEKRRWPVVLLHQTCNAYSRRTPCAGAVGNSTRQDSEQKKAEMTENAKKEREPTGETHLPANAKPHEIINHAVLLNPRDQKALIKAFEAGLYEMAATFVWSKAMVALKRQLGAFGMDVIGEALGRTDLDEASSPFTDITKMVTADPAKREQIRDTALLRRRQIMRGCLLNKKQLQRSGCQTESVRGHPIRRFFC